MSNGFIFHESEDIVCIATFNSSNRKTGDEVQTWILYKHEAPNIAIDTGKDETICGDCKHRGIVLSLANATIYDDKLPTTKRKSLLNRIEDKKAKGLNSINIDRKCYVLVWQAPTVIYKAWKNGNYPTLTPKQAQKRFAYKVVRLGSYGDTIHIPKWKLDIMLKFTLNITGYTHQWKNKKYIEYKQYLMASVDTPKERLLAKSLGYRTFRVDQENDALNSNEVGCLSDKKVRGNKKLVPCVDCGMCNGLTGKVTKDIVVRLH